MKPWLALAFFVAFCWLMLKWINVQTSAVLEITSNGEIYLVHADNTSTNDWLTLYPAVKCFRSNLSNALQRLWVGGGYVIQGNLVPLLAPSEWMSSEVDCILFIDKAGNFFFYSQGPYNKFVSLLLEKAAEKLTYKELSSTVQRWLVLDNFELFLNSTPRKTIKLGVQILKPVIKQGITFAMYGSKAVFAIGL